MPPMIEDPKAAMAGLPMPPDPAPGAAMLGASPGAAFSPMQGLGPEMGMGMDVAPEPPLSRVGAVSNLPMAIGQPPFGGAPAASLGAPGGTLGATPNPPSHDPIASGIVLASTERRLRSGRE